VIGHAPGHVLGRGHYGQAHGGGGGLPAGGGREVRGLLGVGFLVPAIDSPTGNLLLFFPLFYGIIVAASFVFG
jgi:hypothetical protein